MKTSFSPVSIVSKPPMIHYVCWMEIKTVLIAQDKKQYEWSEC